MYDFEYRRAATLEQAIALQREQFDPRWLAGGHSLLPALKQRLAGVGTLIDIRHLPQLQGISREGDMLSIGAATQHALVAASSEVRQAIPGLARLASTIADPQVRNMGTLGGSLAHADPAADYPAGVLACAAEIETSARSIAADDFFKGMFETALNAGELILRVKFRCPLACAYEKLRNPASGYATAGVFVAQFEHEVRVAVTGVAPCALRWTEAEDRLRERFDAAAVQGLELDPEGLNDDLHASADYRGAMAGVLLEDAVRQAISQPPFT